LRKGVGADASRAYNFRGDGIVPGKMQGMACDAYSTSNRWIQAVILVEVDGRRTFPRLQSPGLAHVWSVARMLL
jgi:hypothetical protein